MNNKIIKSFIVLSLILCTSFLNSQSPVNFSGEWTQDSAKSDDFYKEFGITCLITQTPQSIAIKQTFFDKSGKEITSHEESYNLDGKETRVEEQGGINMKSANWSADKKTLTITNTRTVGNEVYGSHLAYSLSENDRVLTVVTTDANPLTGLKVKQIFNKK